MTRLAATFFILLLSQWESSAQAQGSPSTSASKYYYHNGVMRALKLDSTREVDFGTRPGTEPSIVTKGSTAKSLVNKSPLFLDLSTNTERALPGGVVVTFPFETSPERAKALLASEGLSNAKPLVGSQVWLVESAGGQAALDLANRLQESGKFRAAEPNWWSRRSTK